MPGQNRVAVTERMLTTSVRACPRLFASRRTTDTPLTPVRSSQLSFSPRSERSALASLANASARAGPASPGRSGDTTAPARTICAAVRVNLFETVSSSI